MHSMECKPYLAQMQGMREDQVAILPGWLKLALECCQGLKVLKQAGMTQKQSAVLTEERDVTLVVIALRS